MRIRILHIDDDPVVIEQVIANVDGETVSENELRVVDFCDFDEGMQKLSENQYDLIILDLCRGNAAQESDKVGEDVFAKIQARAFIPVVFFTGLPSYVQHLRSDIVKVVGKGEGFDELLLAIQQILESGFLKIRKDVDDMITDGVRSFFWNFVHTKSQIIAQLRQDDVSLKYLLLRRLGKSLTSDFLKATVDEPQFRKELAHPMEFYVFPPLDGEYEAGDIVRCRENHELFVTLTPSCDFVVRSRGNRNAEKILLVHAKKFTQLQDYQKIKELELKHKQITDAGNQLSKDDLGQMKNAVGRVKEMMKPGWNERFFFLPPTPFIEATLVDFQQKQMVSYEQLEHDFEPVASLDDPIAQAVLTSYARYQSRIGYPDLDIEYAYERL